MSINTCCYMTNINIILSVARLCNMWLSKFLLQTILLQFVCCLGQSIAHMCSSSRHSLVIVMGILLVDKSTSYIRTWSLSTCWKLHAKHGGSPPQSALSSSYILACWLRWRSRWNTWRWPSVMGKEVWVCWVPSANGYWWLEKWWDNPSLYWSWVLSESCWKQTEIMDRNSGRTWMGMKKQQL